MSSGAQIAIIVAAAQNGVIGNDGVMPWHLRTDLQRFKALTTGCPVIMGRKTWDSIGRPLPERQNIVISRNHNQRIEGASLVSSLQQALDLAGKTNPDVIFVIGGGQIYRQVLPIADIVYFTQVETELNGDTSFPALDTSIWEQSHKESLPAGQHDTYPTTYKIFERRK